MEHYAMQAARTDSNDAFWCDAATESALLCLDIGAPSTLGNSLNTRATNNGTIHNSLMIYDVLSTANESSVQLFGQVAPCHGRVVGDGVIDVFDIATLLSYLFSDWQYRWLSPNPVDVPTVSGRGGVVDRCGNGQSRYDYLEEYSRDVCVSSLPLPSRRSRRLASSATTRSEMPFPRPRLGLQARDDTIVTDGPVYMMFLKFSCSRVDTARCLDVSQLDGTAYFHPDGVAISRSLSPHTVNLPLVLPLRPDAGSVRIDYGRTRVYHSEGIEYEVVPRALVSPRRAPPVDDADRDRRMLQTSRRRWSTFTIPGTPARLHAVFSGLTETEVAFSSAPFHHDATPSRAEVRLTKRCSGAAECDECATVLTGMSNNIGILSGTLELMQFPFYGSCGFDVHVYHHVDENPLRESSLFIKYMRITNAEGYRNPQWPFKMCVDRRVWSITPSRYSPPPPVPSLPPASPPTGRTLLLPIVSGVLLTVAALNLVLVGYHCLPYPLFDDGRRCYSCGRRSTLRYPVLPVAVLPEVTVPTDGGRVRGLCPQCR